MTDGARHEGPQGRVPEVGPGDAPGTVRLGDAPPSVRPGDAVQGEARGEASQGVRREREPQAAAPNKRPAFEPPGRLLKPTGYHPEMRRPATIVAGAALVLLRVIAGVAVLTGIAVGWDAIIADPDSVLEGFDPTPEGAHAALWFVLAAGGTVLVIDLLLAIFVFRGHNWARVIVMIVAVGSISTSFFAWWVQGQEIKVDETFVSLSLDILLLLALSSRSAAAYARRYERR